MYSEEQLIAKLNEFRNMSDETEWLEFKEAKNGFDFNKLGQYFSALSNEANLKGKHSAWLIFGVKDEAPRKIVGTNFRPTLNDRNALKRDIAQHTNGVTLQEVYELNLSAGRVVMLQIPAAPHGIPTSWKDHCYGREGESLKALSINKRETIRSQSAHVDWSAEICPDAKISDLDEEALKVARLKFHKKYETRLGDDIEKWDVATFLEKAKLTRNGQLTRTTILLLGKPEASHFLNPHPARITWKLETEEEAYEHFGTPFLLSVDNVFKSIRNIKFRFQPANQLIPIELTKYEVKVILEALNNCVAHQDYSQNARIIVREKVDHLLLQNIGEFYEGAIEDYLLKEHVPDRYRNPFLIEAMVNLDMIDMLGMGIKRMFQEQRKRYFPLPDYDLSDQNHVKLTIYGKLIDENYSRLLIEEENLSLSEILALDSIQKKRKISPEVVRDLRKKRLIEGRYPNVFISSRVAVMTDEKAQYIKNRAFDDAHYEKMILDFLDEYGSATRKDIDALIYDKLPEILGNTQKKNKVGNILQKLSKNGKITNTGSFTKSMWIRVES